MTVVEKPPSPQDRLVGLLKLETFADNMVVKQIASKTKLPPNQILLAAFILLSLFLLFTRMGRDALECLLLWFYPAYKTYKALKACSGEEFKYLVYWIVFAGFYSIETVARKLVYWIPFYELIRIAVLVACYHPKYFNLAALYVEPVLSFAFSQLDSNLEEKLYGRASKRRVNFQQGLLLPDSKKK